MKEMLQGYVDRGDVPGVVALVDRGTPETIAVGCTAVGGVPLLGDEIFRIQSMTKAVEAVAALRLVEAGRLHLDKGLVEWLPELANRQVLRSPDADLDDATPAVRPITLRHLLTCSSGYGIAMEESPLQGVMTEQGINGGGEPPTIGADEWLGRLASLPLTFQPGEGWRYHHSFGILGVLLSRVAGQPLGDFLAAEILEPLGMEDTGFWVPNEKLSRLPAADRHGGNGLIEIEPTNAGFYAGPPPFDVSHEEMVSTASDYRRFLSLLTNEGVVKGRRLLSSHHVQMMTTDQVPEVNKTADSFFPGFWDGTGWGCGVAVQTSGAHRGRYGWSGGLGTDFFVEPDGGVGILLTQVEIGERTMPLLMEFSQKA